LGKASEKAVQGPLFQAKSKEFCMDKRFVVVLFALAALCAKAAAQEGSGLATDFTTEGGQLVTTGDYTLRGTVLVQYRGDAAEVVVPPGLGITEIGEGAFGGSEVRSVVFPEGVTKLGSNLFRDCYSLESVTLPQTLSEIGDGAFYLCDNLSSINLPASLASIGELAFAGCGSLSSINLPVGLASIGNYAFSGCDSLSSITLPAGLASIGDSAFFRCSSLGSITLPAGLASIGNSAFSDCDSLSSITLPAGLASIGTYAFNGCEKLVSVTVQSPNPPALNDSLWSSRSAPPAVIYVPSASVDVYKNAEGWKNHADKIRAMEG
jgi:hypothetical protein